ncbi:MAG: hypothetical protein GY940_21060 [bacterium]|nr:hypothetical protein [bacterium]
MRHNKYIQAFILILVLVTIPLHAGDHSSKGEAQEIVIAMCRPSVSQIKNIEHMYEKDIITLHRIKLIAVYHEDEATDYSYSHDYVKEKNLAWVSFRPITGEVKVGDLFKKNAWTRQFKSIFENSHGIIFTGGADIPPAVYGEKNNLLTDASTPVRSYYELSFLFHLLGGDRNPGYVPLLESNEKYSVLGICLGFQTMNVACGGSMYQDIPSQVYGFTSMEQVLAAGQDRTHSWNYIRKLNPREKDLPPAFHRIKLKKNGIFVKEMGMNKKDTPLVLTSHHQALKKIGKNLKVIASSIDGKIVEAISHKKYENVLGIQFHPEPWKLYQKNYFFRKEPGAPLNFNLRRYLISNPPAMSFHKKLWNWFSQSMRE